MEPVSGSHLQTGKAVQAFLNIVLEFFLGDLGRIHGIAGDGGLQHLDTTLLSRRFWSQMYRLCTEVQGIQASSTDPGVQVDHVSLPVDLRVVQMSACSSRSLPCSRRIALIARPPAREPLWELNHLISSKSHFDEEFRPTYLEYCPPLEQTHQHHPFGHPSFRHMTTIQDRIGRKREIIAVLSRREV